MLHPILKFSLIAIGVLIFAFIIYAIFKPKKEMAIREIIPNNFIAINIKVIRIKFLLSQKSLAKLLNINVEIIRHMENDYIIDITYIGLICNYFQINYNIFTFRDFRLEENYYIIEKLRLDTPN